MKIVPFTPESLTPAGDLLATSHRANRFALPELNPRFEATEAACALLQALLKRPNALGVAAFSNGRLIGYLLGDMVFDMLWGRSGWVRFGGCALDPKEDPEIMRDLYAALAKRWVNYGCYAHFAQIAACDAPLLQKWFSLCFGVEHVYGIADIAQNLRADFSPASGIHTRRATPEDHSILRDFSPVIWRHQTQAPVWGIHLPEIDAEQAQAYSELADDPKNLAYLGYHAGEIAGLQVAMPEEEAEDALLVPPHSLYLSVGATHEAHRGRGVASALTQTLFRQAHREGYRYCLTDWRSTNLLSSRVWQKQGYRPVMLRLVRRIDPRIAWAKEPESDLFG